RFSSRLFLVFSPTFPCMRSMSSKMLIIGAIRAVGGTPIWHCAFFRQICHCISVGDSPGPSCAPETRLYGSMYWCRSVIRES
ncbi:hypothetical protein FB451DRAFT_1262388, partial [Mycena latifolia]